MLMVARCALVVCLCMVYVPAASAAMLSFSQPSFVQDLSITSSTVGTGQASVVSLDTQPPPPDRVALGTLLPKGDPFSSASITAEFTVPRAARFLLFGAFPLNDVAGVLRDLGEDPMDNVFGGPEVPWDINIAFARIGPDPELISFTNTARIFLEVNSDGFLDQTDLIGPGRYRLSISSSQAGGLVEAGVGATVIVTPVPEPDSVALFGVGGALAAWAIRRRRSVGEVS